MNSTLPPPPPIPTVFDKGDALAAKAPCWVEIQHVHFLHDPERPDRLEAFEGHEWGLQFPDD